MAVSVHINTVNITPEALPSVMQEVQRGVDPEVLRDIGETVPKGIENVATLSPDYHIEEDLERLEALEQVSVETAQNANSRKNYLIQLVKEVGKQRKAEGFAVNHERTPQDRGKVESTNYEMQKRAKKTLARACGVCALAANCEIRNDLGAWISTHPFADTDRPRIYTSVRDPKVKRTESRMKFLKRLDSDPLAHCIPPKPEEKSKQ